MNFKSTLQNFEGPVYGRHIPIPGDIARKFIEGEDRRVICTLLGKERFHAGLMPMGEQEWFINVNKKICDKLGLVEGQEVDVHLEKDRTEYGMPMPDELREVLNQDEEGSKLFHALTPGKQRNLIYIGSNVKNPNIRLRRAIVIVNHLKMQAGAIDFKALNAEIKAANQAARNY